MFIFCTTIGISNTNAGFKLCEDNPDGKICWLSSSRYIFDTQLENLQAAGGYQPDNVEFLTYAKLMNLTDEEIEGIAPDFIVFDCRPAN